MSIIKPAIEVLSYNHNLIPGIDSNKKRQRTIRDCPLASGIEYSFVGLFCHEILRKIQQEKISPFNHLFYIPNLKAEAEVGYDLSIGHFNQNRRVRSMHKVINERWCDQQWSYRFNFKQNNSDNYLGDYGHFIKLINANQEDSEQPKVQVYPYLVINVCYCIHDYRRMGAKYEDWNLPYFNSLLKTIIVDLRALRNQLEHRKIDIWSEDFYFKIFRVPKRIGDGETAQEFLSRINTKTNLRIICCDQSIEPHNVVLSFDEFCNQVDWRSIFNTIEPKD